MVKTAMAAAKMKKRQKNCCITQRHNAEVPGVPRSGVYDSWSWCYEFEPYVGCGDHLKNIKSFKNTRNKTEVPNMILSP